MPLRFSVGVTSCTFVFLLNTGLKVSRLHGAAVSRKLGAPRHLAQNLVVQSQHQRVHLLVYHDLLLSRRRTTLGGHIVVEILFWLYWGYAVFVCVIVGCFVASYVLESLHLPS